MKVRWIENDKPEWGLFQGAVYEAEVIGENCFIRPIGFRTCVWDLKRVQILSTETVPNPYDKPADKKYDHGKSRYSLLPRECLAGVIAVLEFGAKKYAAWSWPTVPEGLTRYRDAMDRHWDSATGTGLASEPEECDPESGLRHAWHFLCDAIFVAWFLVHKPEQVASYRARQRGESQ